MEDEQMLQYIYKTAEMGKEGILSIMKESKDPALTEALRTQLRDYGEIYNTATNYLNARGMTPQSAGTMAKMSVSITSALKTAADHSPSKIAELMIRGNTTGLTKSIKHLKDYQGDDPKVMELANDLKSAEEAGIEKMKEFL